MTRASRHRRFRAALTLAIALRRHLSRIVRAVFATMLGSTAALAAVDGAAPPTAGLPRPSSPTGKRVRSCRSWCTSSSTNTSELRDSRRTCRPVGKCGSFSAISSGRMVSVCSARAYSRYANTCTSLPKSLEFLGRTGGRRIHSRRQTMAVCQRCGKTICPAQQRVF